MFNTCFILCKFVGMYCVGHDETILRFIQSRQKVSSTLVIESDFICLWGKRLISNVKNFNFVTCVVCKVFSPLL